MRDIFQVDELCMVDRITPVTTNQDILMLREKYDIEDAWPVTCEPYIQCVMEDNFASGRPAWERWEFNLRKILSHLKR